MEYTLSGPSAGLINAASTNFTVTLGTGDPGGTVTITPASNKAGTFTPTSVDLTNGSRSATFTFTPSAAGAHTISTTNDGDPELDDPSSVTYTVARMNYTLTGPETGIVGAASTNFTVTLGTGNPGGTVTITPAATPNTGTFTPSTVSLANGDRTKTFTFTPSSPGTYSIAVTDSSTLDDPAPVPYVVSAVFTSLNTVIKNITNRPLVLSFLNPHGRTLAAGASLTIRGDINNLVRNQWQDRQARDFERALEKNYIEVLSSPATLLKDATTGAIKQVSLNNGSLGTSNPSYGSYTDS